MPAQVRSEFALALNQVASERNITVETILATIEEALLMAYRKDRAMYGETVDTALFLAAVDPNSGEARIYRKSDGGARGDDVTPAGFGRIAAQTAGQVLRQKIREAEKKAVLADFSQRIGTVISGMVLRFDGPNVIIDINKAEAVLPSPEQNPAERYQLSQRLSFYIKEIRDTARGQEIIVSRTDPNLVVELFRKEVPEFQSGAVIVKLIAREAGGRTKLAVASTQSGVDPVGASVGQKGVRVQAVINEVGNNEKVDVIQYTEDAGILIAAALSPAKEIEVVLDNARQSATAFAPDDQLSLAIGRDGQNVRLAAKLTGWKIDIKGKSQKTAPVQIPADDSQQSTDDKKNKNDKKGKKKKISN